MIPSVEVYVSKAGCSAPAECDIHIGTCRFNLRRGAVSTSFSYSSAYLESPNAFAIDPALPLRSTSTRCDGLPGAAEQLRGVHQPIPTPLPVKMDEGHPRAA